MGNQNLCATEKYCSNNEFCTNQIKLCGSKETEEADSLSRPVSISV